MSEKKIREYTEEEVKYKLRRECFLDPLAKTITPLKDIGIRKWGMIDYLINHREWLIVY